MPNFPASAAPIDFTTAFGRLLRDGALRDALAADPCRVVEQLGVREQDRRALLQLVPADLEYQAEILLRKRLGTVREFIPETLRRLAGEAWPCFHHYARRHWPEAPHSGPRDAHVFAGYLRKTQPASVCDREWNRLEFFMKQKRLAVHWVRRRGEGRAGWWRGELQLLVRTGRQAGRWAEWFWHFQL